jgi:hypothetical protein
MVSPLQFVWALVLFPLIAVWLWFFHRRMNERGGSADVPSRSGPIPILSDKSAAQHSRWQGWLGLILAVLGGAYATNVFVDFYANPTVIGDARIHPPLTTRLANWLLLHKRAAMVVGVLLVIGLKLFLQRSSRSRSESAIIAAMILGMIAFSIGMAARPYQLHRQQQEAFKVHLAPEAVEGRVVIVRVFTPDPNHGREMRMVLGGPDDDPEHRMIPRGFKRQPWPEVFVFPSPSPAKQPWSDFGSAKQTLVAFVLPTEALAKEAYRKLGSGPLEFGRVQPPRTFHFDLDPAKPETMTCRLFEVTDGTGPAYTGSLVFSADLVREGHPRWVRVSSPGVIAADRNLEFSWEISTSRPAAFKLRHQTKEGGGGTMVLCDQPTGHPKTYRQNINLLLYKISDTRFGMRLINGPQPNTHEFEGDFDAITRELESLHSGGMLKTERDWDIELCRVAGNPVMLRVEDPPPPTVVENANGIRPLGSNDPRWVEITFEGDKKNPPSANGPQKLPGFHRFLWLLRASRPGFVKVTGPHGAPLIAPLAKSEESGLYEALYALELVPVDDRTTEVRRALGPKKDAMQIAQPYEELSQRVKESACSTNPARETASMLHRYGPVTSPMVSAIVTDRPSEASATNTSVTPVPEERLWQLLPGDLRSTDGGSVENPGKLPDASIQGRVLDAQGKPVPQRVLRVLNPVMEPTHLQPQVFAETLTSDEGTFHLTLPVGKPFVVVLPADGTNAEARGQQLMISMHGGPEGRTVDLIHGEMDVKIDGTKLEAHFRGIREIPDSTTPPPAQPATEAPTAPAQGQPALEKE